MQEFKVGQVWRDEYSYKIEVIAVGEHTICYRGVTDGRHGVRDLRVVMHSYTMIKDADPASSDLEIVQKALCGREADLLTYSFGNWRIRFPSWTNRNEVTGDGAEELLAWAKQTIEGVE